jgi:hypothetical protein
MIALLLLGNVGYPTVSSSRLALMRLRGNAGWREERNRVWEGLSFLNPKY